MTLKKTHDPAGLLTMLRSNCTVESGHSIYTGPLKVQLGGRLLKPATAWWILTFGQQPPDKPFIVQTCNVAGCIDPDCHTPSRSPHGVMPDTATDKRTKEQAQTANVLECILARLDSIDAALARLDAKLEGLQ
jgi:hypothetical protein